jgi:uridine kinase
MRIYSSTFFIILLKAFYDLFPNGQLVIDHSISKGYYCYPELGRLFDFYDIKKLSRKIEEIISKNLPITMKNMEVNQARDFFKQKGFFDTYELLKFLDSGNLNVYFLKDNCEFYNEPLLPSTGYIEKFNLRPYSPGFIVQIPYYTKEGRIPEFVEEKKLFTIFRETYNQNKILGINNVVDMNKAICNNRIGEVIQLSESFHEKKIQDIANEIDSRRSCVRFILISGPSSSGKTTFSKRLSIALRLHGIKPIAISLDDYFLDREKTPRDESGEYDYESLYAIDLELLNNNIFSLLRGDEITLPKFNFIDGKRENGEKIKLTKDQMLIIEGIHGLNPKLTENIPGYLKYNIYVSALTQLNIDYHHRIPTTDGRIIRRIVRDSLYRGHSALSTIKMWPNVRKGEEKNIFPYQENADVMFNSALVYELALLKRRVVPLLEEIDDSKEEYPEASRLLNFLSFFKSIDDKEIPPTSILREFIGGSSFNY